MQIVFDERKETYHLTRDDKITLCRKKVGSWQGRDVVWDELKSHAVCGRCDKAFRDIQQAR